MTTLPDEALDGPWKLPGERVEAPVPIVLDKAAERREMQLWSDWAWKKPGDAVGHMDGQRASMEAWMARAAIAAQPAAEARSDFQRECDAADELMRLLGLDPDRCRTEGGAINMGRVRSLLDAAEARPVAPAGWIACDERMPDEGAEVLVWVVSAPGNGYAAPDQWIEYHEDPTGMGGPTLPMGLMWRDNDPDEVTHWMPLPPPPGASPAAPAPPVERDPSNTLEWLGTHCRAIGMTRRSDSGLLAHDIALFTIDLQEAARTAAASAAVAQGAWLVEWRFNGVQWLYLWPRAAGGFSFTGDANRALRFARREDAEAALQWARDTDAKRGAGRATGDMLVTQREWPCAAPPARPVEPAGWLPIETAPKDGSVLLTDGVTSSEGGWVSDIEHGAEWEGQLGMAGWWSVSLTGKPTGWMPLPPPPGASPAAPAPVALDAPAELRSLDTSERVRFYEHDFYVLSNFSAFHVHRRGISFETSEAAYHWEKFADCVPHIAAQIIYAPSAHDAFKIAERNKALRRPDWDDVKVGIMRDILRAKAAQHEYVRRKLLATGDRELVEDSWRDDFWGWGPNRDGKNMLGRLWMEVRSELRAHGISAEG